MAKLDEDALKLSKFFTASWTFPETLLAIAAANVPYLALVYWIIPHFMRNREPFKLKRTLLVYNAFQFAYSAYVMYYHARYSYNYGIITSRCSTGDDLPLVRTVVFPCFIAKHIDLLDTIFFALRKKNNQVTFLHVFHHVTMVGLMWFIIYHPNDHFMSTMTINNFVHVLMYAYYGISSLGPEYAKYVIWKKNLTQIQLVQFVAALTILYCQQNFSPCPLPPPLHYYAMICVSSYMLLFLNFYVRSYNKKNINNYSQKKH